MRAGLGEVLNGMVDSSMLPCHCPKCSCWGFLSVKYECEECQAKDLELKGLTEPERDGGR